MQRALINVNLTWLPNDQWPSLGFLFISGYGNISLREKIQLYFRVNEKYPSFITRVSLLVVLALSEGLFDTFTSVLWRVYRYPPSPRQISSFLEGQAASII